MVLKLEVLQVQVFRLDSIFRYIGTGNENNLIDGCNDEVEGLDVTVELTPSKFVIENWKRRLS